MKQSWMRLAKVQLVGQAEMVGHVHRTRGENCCVVAGRGHLLTVCRQCDWSSFSLAFVKDTAKFGRLDAALRMVSWVQWVLRPWNIVRFVWLNCTSLSCRCAPLLVGVVELSYQVVLSFACFSVMMIGRCTEPKRLLVVSINRHRRFRANVRPFFCLEVAQHDCRHPLSALHGPTFWCFMMLFGGFSLFMQGRAVHDVFSPN